MACLYRGSDCPRLQIRYSCVWSSRKPSNNCGDTHLAARGVLSECHRESELKSRCDLANVEGAHRAAMDVSDVKRSTEHRRLVELQEKLLDAERNSRHQQGQLEEARLDIAQLVSANRVLQSQLQEQKVQWVPYSCVV